MVHSFKTRAVLVALLASASESFVPSRQNVHSARSVSRISVNVASSMPQPSEDDQQAAGLRAVISNVTSSAVASMSMEGDLDEEAVRKRRTKLAERQRQASSGSFRVQLSLARPAGLSFAEVKQGRKILQRELDLDQLILEEVDMNGSSIQTMIDEQTSRQRMDWPTVAGRLDPDFHGLLVSSVVQGSPAWEAGIRAGDMLKALSATVGEALWPTSTLDGMQSAWRSRKMLSQNAVLEFIRMEERIDNVFELTLEKPLGLEVQETTDGFVVVTGFKENAPNLVRHAVQIGDRIVAVDSSWGNQMWPVSTVEGLVSACTSRFPRNTVHLRLERPVENLELATMPTEPIDLKPPSAMSKSSASQAVSTTTGAARRNPPINHQELLKRCRDVLQRYKADPNDNAKAVAAFKGKYDVPAIVADKVVDTLASERVSLDSVTLSMITAAYLSCNQPESALAVFEAAVGFRSDGSPSPVTESLIGRNGGGFLPNESALNLFVATSVMQAHAQRGDILAVSRVLAALEGRSGVLVGGVESAPWPFTGVYGSIRPDTQCYNVAIAAAEKVGGDEALEMGLALFDKMSDPKQMKTASDRSPVRDVVTYNTMISALCNAGRSDEAFRLFDRMKRSSIRPDKFTYTPLIKACASDDDVQELFYDMQERGVKGDVRTYNTMIKLLCNHRKLSEATRMVMEMETRGISPDSMTYGLLMHAMLKADKATACLTLFESACASERSSSITENVYLYTTAITAASILGNYERSLELLTRMAAKGVKPNLQTLTAVVGSCLNAQKPDLALKVFSKIEAPDGYALLQGLKAYCVNGDYAKALSMLKKQDQNRRERVLSGKQMMLAYKHILEASLTNGDFAVARDTVTNLLKTGNIPNKAILNTMLSALNVADSRQMSVLLPSEQTGESYEFLLFVLDSLTARKLPVESSLYLSIISLGTLLGGHAKRVAQQVSRSRKKTESYGTRIISTDAETIAERSATSFAGWRTVYQNESLSEDSLLMDLNPPQIQVRVLPREFTAVLKAENALATSTKTRKRRTAATPVSTR